MWPLFLSPMPNARNTCMSEPNRQTSTAGPFVMNTKESWGGVHNKTTRYVSTTEHDLHYSREIGAQFKDE